MYVCVDFKTLKCFEEQKHVDDDKKKMRTRTKYYVHKLGDVRLFEIESIVLMLEQNMAQNVTYGYWIY
jgi:hypothetical protein